MATPEVGSPAPAFTLPAHDGSEVTLSDLRGKRVVVYFYPKDDTPGCTTEAKGFRDLKDDFAAANTVILGISADSLKRHCNFVAKYELNFQLLADPDKTAIEAFGCWVEKKNYGRTYMGIQRATFLIDEQGTVAAAWPKVRVKRKLKGQDRFHVEDVLDAVRELG